MQAKAYSFSAEDSSAAVPLILHGTAARSCLDASILLCRISCVSTGSHRQYVSITGTPCMFKLEESDKINLTLWTAQPACKLQAGE